MAKEAVDIYKRYLTMEEYIVYKEIQRDRLWAKTEINRGIMRGRAEGKREEKLDRAYQIVSKKYQGENLEWLKTCTSEQLNYIFDIILDDIDYIRFQEKVLNFRV